MKLLKSKIFTKPVLIVLALMLMLTPINLGVFATDEGIAEETVAVAMSSGHTHSSSCYTEINVLRACFQYGPTCNQGHDGCKGGNYNHGWVDTWYILSCGN
jgi:hypothetical protein